MTKHHTAASSTLPPLRQDKAAGVAERRVMDGKVYEVERYDLRTQVLREVKPTAEEREAIEAGARVTKQILGA